MAKTYTALTAANATAGNAILASDHSAAFTNLNNLRVPPSCSVYRSSDLSPYTSGAAVTWQAAHYDTESTASSPSDPMWAAGANADKVYIRTAGLYLITFRWYLTAGAGTITLIECDLKLNASTFMSISNTPTTTGSVSYGTQTFVQSLVAGDYVYAGVGVTGGSSYVIKGSATNDYTQTSLRVTWLGQVS